MKADQFRKNEGQRFKLRPMALEFSFASGWDEVDDDWLLEHVGERSVALSNLRTGHKKELEFDNIRERRSPNFLLLHCQLYIEGDAVRIEPLLPPHR